jgi:UDP-N-acetylmuramoylalanine--D-glutamate ligase
MTRTLIIGAGKSGVAAANFLAARGEDVSITDANADPELPYPLHASVNRAFGREDRGVLDGIGMIVLSPGVPSTISLLSHTGSIPVVGEIELAYRYVPRGSRIVAVTGSNGKSTTTMLIGEILKVAGLQPIVAGNIGEPFIAAVDLERPRTYVLELSSFQLESVDTFHANVALLLNVTPDHMDRYASFDAYAAAKYRIFRNQQAHDVAVVNAADRRAQPRDSISRLWRFSSTQVIEEGAFLDGGDLVLRIDGQERRIPRASLKLEGTANAENALAAWLAVKALGVDEVSVQIAFGSFAGLPHRMVLVREVDGVRWINDSKGTNVDATVKSLESFPASSVWLILGGKDKAGEFERMRELVKEKTCAVLTIGAAAGRVAAALDGAATIVTAGDMQHAVAYARENAKPGDVVLLSPACASFDQYRNFEHRGEHFEELVRGLSTSRHPTPDARHSKTP